MQQKPGLLERAHPFPPPQHKMSSNVKWAKSQPASLWATALASKPAALTLVLARALHGTQSGSFTVQIRPSHSPLMTGHHPRNSIPALYPWPTLLSRESTVHTLLTSCVTASSQLGGPYTPLAVPRGGGGGSLGASALAESPVWTAPAPHTCMAPPHLDSGVCSTVTSQTTFQTPPLPPRQTPTPAKPSCCFNSLHFPEYHLALSIQPQTACLTPVRTEAPRERTAAPRVGDSARRLAACSVKTS